MDRFPTIRKKRFSAEPIKKLLRSAGASIKEKGSALVSYAKANPKIIKGLGYGAGGVALATGLGLGGKKLYNTIKNKRSVKTKLLKFLKKNKKKLGLGAAGAGIVDAGLLAGNKLRRRND